MSSKQAVALVCEGCHHEWDGDPGEFNTDAGATCPKCGTFGCWWKYEEALRCANCGKFGPDVQEVVVDGHRGCSRACALQLAHAADLSGGRDAC